MEGWGRFGMTGATSGMNKRTKTYNARSLLAILLKETSLTIAPRKYKQSFTFLFRYIKKRSLEQNHLQVILYAFWSREVFDCLLREGNNIGESKGSYF